MNPQTVNSVIVIGVSHLNEVLPFAVFGLCMLIFPGLVIAISDVGAAIRGYKPIKDHPFRSHVLIRVLGALMIAFAAFVFLAESLQ